ncbi:type II toxin-antitoxin system VapB family antitoxin [Mesorhizobium sp. ESP7-2]|uniref:type II toxin-antitoxin system VapB family antitoxin n=1 Tax=Mesorhizobium sp. ESP7-2 TaxID=2876622 RepID=UPI001CCC9CDC|nr:type II toxin-antitoxin system VapB family antitoxin [Mesorhizobium sp. ESP7-2]
MALSIKNRKVEELARELARGRGISVTEAIRQSLESDIALYSVTSWPNESDLIIKPRKFQIAQVGYQSATIQ